jgi:peptidoglycan/xylan/chitin deacetylase (PgdA/CDA1 family)
VTAAARSVVLYYHRAATPACDPFQLAVSPDRLSEQLAVLAANAEVVPLEDLASRRAERHREPRVAVTFDDGYADNLHEVAPRVAAAGLSATVFVASSVLTATRELWWDRLGHVFGDREPTSPVLQVGLAGPPVSIDVGSQPARDRATTAVRNRLVRLPPAQIDAAIEEIAAALGVAAPAACRDHALLSEAQLKRLAASPGIAIGSHTVRHPQLSALASADQAHELQRSRSDLEAVTGQPVTAFAYPFGGRDSYGRDTVSLLRRSGYRTAYTTDQGPVRRLTSSMRLPRHRVENWTGEQFERALRSWLGTS